MNVDPVMYSYLLRIKNYDLNTYFHCCRVASISAFIGRSIDLTATELKTLYISACLHDIGKIQVPKTIINNPGKLDSREWATLKKHPVFGADLINGVLKPDVIKGISAHHERWDGSGYPYRLKGEDIPLVGRIIAVADSFDAMTSLRPYRQSLFFKAAIKEVLDHKGSQFDPYLVKSIAKPELENILREKGVICL